MSHRVLHAADAYWRVSNQMGVLNTDLAKQLDAPTLGARLWRLAPGQASTRHRHAEQSELYLLLEGTGRIRVGGELLTLEPLSAVLAEPNSVRQVFNDTAAEALWLVVGAPREAANTLEMTEEQLHRLYPDGPQALPPELAPEWDLSRFAGERADRDRVGGIEAVVLHDEHRARLPGVVASPGGGPELPAPHPSSSSMPSSPHHEMASTNAWSSA